MSVTTTETADRDARGRFTRGNKGGPGNPFARASAQRRAAILEVVSNEDIQDVFRVLCTRPADHVLDKKIIVEGIA